MVAEFGYAGKILKVDLSQKRTAELQTADYADRFLGGRGIAARIYWDEVAGQVKAFDPENCLIFMTGPLAGFSGFAGSRWQVCGKSPAMDPESFSYASLGGSWGVWLKYAGYDGVVIQGESEGPVYLFITDGGVEIRDATSLWGKTSIEVCDSLKAELGKKVRVVAIGPAGENRVSFATMLADQGSSGSSGFGAVMGAKKLKAIAVAGNKRLKAADPERARNLADRAFQLKNGYWGTHGPAMPVRTRLQRCHGCTTGCFRQSYEAEGGKSLKFFCQATDVYRRPAEKYHDGWSEVSLLATRLCDRYGLDTAVMQAMVEWLIICYKQGVLREKETGIPLSKIGSAEFVETLVRKIAFREGFGDLLSRGTIKAAETVGEGAKELIRYTVLTRANELKDYDPRLIITNALFYATEPRRPIQQLHETGHTLIHWLNWLKGEKDSFLSTNVFLTIADRFWGGVAAADFSTYDGKALAAKKIQDKAYAKESLILCDIFWPIISVRHSDDHVGDPTLEAQVFSAITGKELDEEGLNRFGEKVFNLQRAILSRQGWGGRDGDSLLDYLHEEPIEYVRFDRECIVPGRDGEPSSRKGEVVEKEKFEKMKSEYYELRGWDVESGLQTKAKLRELGLGDIADDLGKRGLSI